MWSLESPKNHAGFQMANPSFIPTPTKTTNKEAGSAFIQENFCPSFVHENKITSPATEITKAPILIEDSDSKISEKVFSPSFWSNSNSPIKSKSSPIACGICFKMMTIPIATSIPRMTDEGKNPPIFPHFNKPNVTWIKPAIITATKNPGNDPKSAIAVATIIVKPAAGPLTESSEPDSKDTNVPPTIPAIRPAKSGAPEASAIPKQRGKATKKTAIPDFQSPLIKDWMYSDCFIRLFN